MREKQREGVGRMPENSIDIHDIHTTEPVTDSNYPTYIGSA